MHDMRNRSFRGGRGTPWFASRGRHRRGHGSRRLGPLRRSRRLRHLQSGPDLVSSPISMGNFLAVRRTFFRKSRNFSAASWEARRRPFGFRAGDRAGRRRAGAARSRGQGGQARALESTEPGPPLVLTQGRKCAGGGRGRTLRRDPRRADRRARPAAAAPRRFRMTDRAGTAGRDGRGSSFPA